MPIPVKKTLFDAVCLEVAFMQAANTMNFGVMTFAGDDDRVYSVELYREADGYRSRVQRLGRNFQNETIVQAGPCDYPLKALAQLRERVLNGEPFAGEAAEEPEGAQP